MLEIGQNDRTSYRHLLLSLIPLVLLPISFPVLSDKTEWFLFGREGDCVQISAAAKREPLLVGITHPDDLVARLKKDGEVFEIKQIVTHPDSPRILTIPNRKLSLVFAPISECQSVHEGPR